MTSKKGSISHNQQSSSLPLLPSSGCHLRVAWTLGAVSLDILECVVLFMCSSDALLDLPLRDVESRGTQVIEFKIAVE